MKLKKSSMDAAESVQAAAPQQGAYISARLRNPGEAGAAASSSDSGSKAGLVCAILTILILGAITVMLYMNWDLIKAA